MVILAFLGHFEIKIAAQLEEIIFKKIEWPLPPLKFYVVSENILSFL